MLKMITLLDPRKARVLCLVAEIYFLCSKACTLHSLAKFIFELFPKGPTQYQLVLSTYCVYPY